MNLFQLQSKTLCRHITKIGALAFVLITIFISGCDSACTDDGLNGDNCVTEAPSYITNTLGGNVNGDNGSLNATIPRGFYDGTTTATMADTSLTAANIVEGSTVFGIAGTAPSAACTADSLNTSACVTGESSYVSGTLGGNVNGTNGSLSTTIPMGFYDGTTTTTMADTNLTPDHITAGTTVFGIAGAAPSALCNDDALNISACVTPTSSYVSGTLGDDIDGEDGSLTVTIPMGFYDGTTTATMTDNALVESNIKSGVTIFGVSGTLPSAKVGDCMGGGVVYYVNSDPSASIGEKGLIAAPTDALSSTTMAWQSGGPTTITPTPEKTYFTGETNTEAILATIGIFPAASEANSYTIDGDDCDDCTTWHLPSQDELATLYAQSTSSIALGDTTFWSACDGTTPSSASYWSSTQGTVNSQAYSVSFLTGIVTTSTSSSNFRVRAIRAF